MKTCAICHGGCCRRYNQQLWGSDIIKICETLNIDINFFTSVFVVPKEQAAELGKTEPLFIFTDSGEEQYYSLVLKFNESKYFPGTSKCIFLHEWSADALGSEELSGIIGRCGIYSCRPLTCSSYPAKYDPEQKNVIVRDPHLVLENEHRAPSDNPAYKLCPSELAKEDYEPFMESYTNTAVLNYNEKQFFLQLAEKWNKNPDVSDNFYPFLKKEYGDRIKLIK